MKNGKRTSGKRLAAKRPSVADRKWQPTHRSQDRILQNTGVYLMWNIPFFMLNKFGISDTVGKRRKNVSETTPGIVFTVLSFNLAYGLEIEQFVHRLYKLQNVHFWTGSGRTEWFIVFSPIVGFSTLYVNWRFGFEFDDKILICAFFTPFVWWDGLLWLMLFWFFKIILIGVVFMFFVYAIAHIN